MLLFVLFCEIQHRPIISLTLERYLMHFGFSKKISSCFLSETIELEVFQTLRKGNLHVMPVSVTLRLQRRWTNEIENVVFLTGPCKFLNGVQGCVFMIV